MKLGVLYSFLSLLISSSVLSQKKEIEFLFNPTIFIKKNDVRYIQATLHYKYLPNILYLPIKEPLILVSGLEYLHYNDGVKMNKLIIPLIFNFSRGDEYRLYTGVGIYGSANFNHQKIGSSLPTLFQIGGSFNLGFQFKIKNKIFINTEFKYRRDLSKTFIVDDYDRSAEAYMDYKSINLGCTYRLSN